MAPAMAPAGAPRLHRWLFAAGLARLPRRAIAWGLAILVVLFLHMLVLQQMASVLPGLAADTAPAPAFMTRTVRLGTAAPTPVAEPAAVEPPSPKIARAAPPVQASQPAGSGAPVARAVPTAAESLHPKPIEPSASAVASASSAASSAAASSPTSAPTPASVSAPTPPSPPGSPSAASAAAPPAATATVPLYDYLIPGSTRLKYEVSGRVKGFGYHVSGELLWLQDGKTYDARLEMSHFLLGSRVQTSKGALTAQGLEPLRFGDKVRSEVAAHFERAKGKVSFSANTPDAPLQPLAQDQLSIFVQLAAMWGGNAARFAPGMQLPFQAVGPRSAENWVFVVGPAERLKVGDTEMAAVKLLRERSADYDVRVELWLAPSLDYLPARIRLTQSNGDEVDMLWHKSEKP